MTVHVRVSQSSGGFVKAVVVVVVVVEGVGEEYLEGIRRVMAEGGVSDAMV